MNKKYNNLSRKELSQLVDNLQESLNQVKEKLDEKQNLVNEALKTYNWSMLEKILKNEDFELDSSDWANLDFTKMTNKDLNFYIHISKLKDYKYYDENSSSYSKLSKTQEAIYASLHDKNLFDYFVNQKEYFATIKIIANNYGIKSKVSIDVINELSNKNLLEFTEELYEQVIDNYCFNYLEYFIKNNVYKLNEEDYKEIYLRTWTSIPESCLKTLEEKYPEYKLISLSELINQFEIIEYAKDDYVGRMKTLLKQEPNVFFRVVDEHSMNAYDIDTLMEAFQEYSPKSNNLLQQFIEFIVPKKPKHLFHLKKFPCALNNPEFKNMYEKLINYTEMKMTLENKDATTNKKMKI